LGISLQRPTIYPQSSRQEFLYLYPWGNYGIYPPGFVWCH
jgi:hypothetical protein